MGHPCLRTPAVDIPPDAIGSESVQRLIDDMISTMVDYGGIGLAAPQVFRGLRLIVVGDPDLTAPDSDPAEMPEAEVPDLEADGTIPLTVVVNPKIVAQSEEMVDGWEGCLSMPLLHGIVPRHQRTEVTGLDRAGNPIQLVAEEYFARVLQHEIDHLEGVLYLERMTDFSSLCYDSEYHRYHLS